MSVWWHAVSVPTPNVLEQMKAIFFDIAEAAHLQPSEFWGSQSSRSASAAAASTSAADFTVLPNAVPSAYTPVAPAAEEWFEEVDHGDLDDGDSDSQSGNDAALPVPSFDERSDEEGDEHRMEDERSERRGTPAAPGAQSETEAPRGQVWPPRGPVGRKRRRSRSIVMERNVEADATHVGVGDVDLTVYMTSKEIMGLSEEDKEQLRAVVRTHARQDHFAKSWTAASGARLLYMSLDEGRRRDKDKADFFGQLLFHGNPLPEAQDYIDGIDHKSSNANVRGVLLNVPQAIHTCKMHYYTLLKKKWKKP